VLPTADIRDMVAERLKIEGIQTSIHYPRDPSLFRIQTQGRAGKSAVH
jgi:hypothetical protein